MAAKNKKTQKLFGLIVIFLLIFGLVSCSSPAGSGEDSGNNQTSGAEVQDLPASAEDTAEQTTEIPEPDYDFGGYEFRVLVNGDQFGDYRSREFYAPEETGDVINDAVYKRNITAEEKYNFTLLAQQNMLMDLKSLPNLSVGNPWWDQRANENLSIGGKLFFTTGDISIVLTSL